MQQKEDEEVGLEDHLVGVRCKPLCPPPRKKELRNDHLTVRINHLISSIEFTTTNGPTNVEWMDENNDRCHGQPKNLYVTAVASRFTVVAA